jgi:periplasmic divalent cation tolerance protein
MESAFIEVITTIDDEKKAYQLADYILEKKLAACAQVSGPFHSLYRWKGKKETTLEWSVIFKTIPERFEEIQAAIRMKHHYEIPEIITIPVTGGSRDYLEWIRREIKKEE